MNRHLLNKREAIWILSDMAIVMSLGVFIFCWTVGGLSARLQIENLWIPIVVGGGAIAFCLFHGLRFAKKSNGIVWRAVLLSLIPAFLVVAIALSVFIAVGVNRFPTGFIVSWFVASSYAAIVLAVLSPNISVAKE